MGDNSFYYHKTINYKKKREKKQKGTQNLMVDIEQD